MKSTFQIFALKTLYAFVAFYFTCGQTWSFSVWDAPLDYYVLRRLAYSKRWWNPTISTKELIANVQALRDTVPEGEDAHRLKLKALSQALRAQKHAVAFAAAKALQNLVQQPSHDQWQKMLLDELIADLKFSMWEDTGTFNKKRQLAIVEILNQLPPAGDEVAARRDQMLHEASNLSPYKAVQSAASKALKDAGRSHDIQVGMAAKHSICPECPSKNFIIEATPSEAEELEGQKQKDEVKLLKKITSLVRGTLSLLTRKGLEDFRSRSKIHDLDKKIDALRKTLEAEENKIDALKSRESEVVTMGKNEYHEKGHSSRTQRLAQDLKRLRDEVRRREVVVGIVTRQLNIAEDNRHHLSLIQEGSSVQMPTQAELLENGAKAQELLERMNAVSEDFAQSERRAAEVHLSSTEELKILAEFSGVVTDKTLEASKPIQNNQAMSSDASPDPSPVPQKCSEKALAVLVE